MILQDRIGIITGAAQGLGREYALGAARAGAKIVAADIADTSDTVAAVEAAGGEGLSVTADVADEASTRDLAAAAINRFGRIDFLVNNAAIYGALEMKYWEDIGVDEWDRIMAVNVRGMVLVSKAVAPYMENQHSGKIINISSGTAHQGVVGALHYVTSKAAVIGFTRALAREVGDFGINVNAISPGFTMSEASRKIMREAGAEMMEDLIVSQQCFKRAERPEDLVGSVLFLASDLSGFITGQVLNVDGGWVMY
ncbi:MAG: hypothetical protein QOI86_3990 [Actinomycetota bacterium]|nr:hypothetical protein [Actinomycetota bacterium]